MIKKFKKLISFCLRSKSSDVRYARIYEEGNNNGRRGRRIPTRGTKERTVEDDDDEEFFSRRIPPFMQKKGATPGQVTAYDKFAREVFTRGVDGLLKEYNKQLKPYIGNPFSRITFDQNAAKNRYKNVICNNLTRIVIADGKDSDYIHANYIRGHPLCNEFICTQGPLKSTQEEFWRMVLFLKLNYIVMLCDTVELGRTKCEQYWPAKKGESMVFGDITVENVHHRVMDHSIDITTLNITRSNDELHKVRHHHWKKWPDRSISKTPRSVLTLLRYVHYSPKPIVVHCSAGIGRTGTLVAIKMYIHSILQTGILDLVAICKRLRDQRLGVLQVDTQFVFLALVVLDFGRAMHFYRELPEQAEEFNKFKNYLNAIVVKRDETQQNNMLMEKTPCEGAPLLENRAPTPQISAVCKVIIPPGSREPTKPQ